MLSVSDVHLCFLQGLTQKNKLSSEVGVVGQRVSYSNGTITAEEQMTEPSSPFVIRALRESGRALKPGKGHTVMMSKSTELYLELPLW